MIPLNWLLSAVILSLILSKQIRSHCTDDAKFLLEQYVLTLPNILTASQRMNLSFSFSKLIYHKLQLVKRLKNRCQFTKGIISNWNLYMGNTKSVLTNFFIFDFSPLTKIDLKGFVLVGNTNNLRKLNKENTCTNTILSINTAHSLKLTFFLKKFFKLSGLKVF